MLAKQKDVWIFYSVSGVFVINHHSVCVWLQTEQQAQRALLIQGTESLNNASQSIARSQRIAIESEHIGTDIIEELGQQREQLDRTRDRVRHREAGRETRDRD